MTDEIIKALRATKEQLAQEAGFDIRRLIETIQAEEKRSAAVGRVVLQPPDDNRPASEFQQIRFISH